LLPVWLLQQPRGYLGGWMLYLACAVGLLGILFGGFDIKRDAFEPVGSYANYFAGGEGAPPMTALVFPFLFVTIACGACSGFHGLICGGTTSKQISKESHCKSIGFGAMLLEGLVAVVALSTIMIVSKAEATGRAPGVIYGDGLAMYITSFFDRASVRDGTWTSSPIFVVAATFGAMAFSTFVFDTLDVSARLGRYLLTELTGVKARWMGYVASLVTVLIPLALLLGPASNRPSTGATTGTAAQPAWQLFWTLFGSSNQLLAALTLLGVTVWLIRTGKRCWYVAGPMAFVMCVTVAALGIQVFAGASEVARGGLAWSPVVVNGIAATLLLGLAGVFVVEAWRAVRTARPAARQPQAH
jgi:carbon starvation protein